MRSGGKRSCELWQARGTGRRLCASLVARFAVLEVSKRPDHGRGWTRFDVTAPDKVFRDGTRLYAFVPYIGASTFGGHPHTTRASTSRSPSTAVRHGDSSA
jgi:hypothetical protein